MIATIETPHTLITGPPGLIKVNREGSTVTILQNCGPYGIWIEKDTVIGFADEMNEQDKMEKMDYKFINAMTSQIKINSINEDKAKNGLQKPKQNTWINWRTSMCPKSMKADTSNY